MFSDLSAGQFETWCRQFFERLYGCEVTNLPDTADFGRDLLIHHPDGLIVVECKHTPSGSVGRPIIQKLHSAAQYSGATRAYVATSGRIAKTAKHYAQKIDIEVEFFDGGRLQRLSSRSKSSASAPPGTAPDELAFAPFGPDEFEQLVRATLLSRHHFDAGGAGRRPVAVVSQVTYQPFVVVDFAVTGSMDSAKGVWRVRWEGSAWLTADTDGEPLFGMFDARVSGDVPTRRIEDTECHGGLRRHRLGECEVEPLGEAVARMPGELPPVPVSLHAAEERLRSELLSTLGQSVTYYGGNNVQYTRTVEPSARELQVVNARVVRLPRRAFGIGFSDTVHQGLAVGLDDGLAVWCDSLRTCWECAHEITAGRLRFCARCLAAVHASNFLRPDGRPCAECSAWVCWSCLRGRWQRPVCADCDPTPYGKPPSKTAKAVLFAFGLLPVTVLLGGGIAAAADLPVPVGAILAAALGFVPILVIKRRGSGSHKPGWHWFRLPRRHR